MNRAQQVASCSEHFSLTHRLRRVVDMAPYAACMEERYSVPNWAESLKRALLSCVKYPGRCMIAPRFLPSEVGVQKSLSQALGADAEPGRSGTGRLITTC